MKWPALTMLAAVLVCCIAAVIWWARPVPAPRPETPAPEQRQADGSLILARQATTPAARPKQQIPPAAKVERIAQATVQPDAPAPEAGQPCPPVTVDLTLIREPDGARRILASSPDGVVVGGIDVPVEPIILPAPAKRWAAGLSWSPLNGTSGVWIERDVRLPILGMDARIGLDVRQGVQASALGVDGLIRIGIAF